jgi:hypothetical protein
MATTAAEAIEPIKAMCKWRPKEIAGPSSIVVYVYWTLQQVVQMPFLSLVKESK